MRRQRGEIRVTCHPRRAGQQRSTRGAQTGGRNRGRSCNWSKVADEGESRFSHEPSQYGSHRNTCNSTMEMPLLHLASTTVHNAPQQPSTVLGPHLPLAGRAGWAPASSRWSAQSEWPKRHAECSGVLHTSKHTQSPALYHIPSYRAYASLRRPYWHACGFPSGAQG